MSHHFSAKQFDNEYEYDQYKKETRKQSKTFSEQRRQKRDRWQSNQE
jgi:hypothetical protein